MRADGFYWVLLSGNTEWGVVSQYAGQYFYVGREVQLGDIETWGARIETPRPASGFGRITTRNARVGDWCYSFGEERYDGPYRSRADAIKAAGHDEESEDSDVVHVAQIADAPTLEDVVLEGIQVEWILETAEQYVADNYGAEEAAIELTLGASDALEVALTAAVSSWANAEYRGRVAWWVAGKSEKVSLAKPTPKGAE